MANHVHDGRDPTAFLSKKACPGMVELDFRRGIGTIPELILKADEMERIPGAVWLPARKEETGKTAFRALARISHR